MRLPTCTCTYQRRRSYVPVACRVPQRAKIVMKVIGKKVKNKPVACKADSYKKLFSLFISLSLLMPFLSTYQCPIVERLTNSLMMHGRNNGKKLMAIRIVKHSFEIINLLTNEVQYIEDVRAHICTHAYTHMNMHIPTRTTHTTHMHVYTPTLLSLRTHFRCLWMP